VSGNVTCALGAAASAGDSVVACARAGSSYDVLAFSDSVNGSWTELGTQREDVAHTRSRCGVFINSGSGTPTVTANFNNVTGTATLDVVALSGVKTTGSFVAEGGTDSSGASNAADPITCGNASATAASQALIAYVALNSAASGIAPNNGETEIVENSVHSTQLEFKLTAGSGNIAGTWDLNTAIDYTCDELIIDAAIVAGPSFSSGPTYSTTSNTQITATFTANLVGLSYYCALYAPGASAPTAAQVAAGTNAHSAVVTGSTTGASEAHAMTASDSPSFPKYDPYCVAYNGSTYTSVPTTTTTATTPPTGFQYVTLASVTATGSEPKAYNDADLITLGYDTQTANFTVGSVVVDATSGAWGYVRVDVDVGAAGVLTIDKRSGTFANNDVLYDQGGAAALVNGSESAYISWATSDVLVVPTTVSPAAVSLTVDTSGQYGYTANGRQTALSGLVFHAATSAYFTLPVDAWFNNAAPVGIPPPKPQNTVFKNGTAIDFDVSAYFQDADNDTLTYARISSLPAGATFNPTTGHMTGTVTADATTSASFIAYDAAGDYGSQSITFIVQTVFTAPNCTSSLTFAQNCAQSVVANTFGSVVVTQSYQCSATIASGYVISQSPASGGDMAPGSTFEIVASSGNVCSTKSPDCTSLPTTLSSCQDLYTTTFGGQVRFATSARCNNSLASGYVISTSPKAGAQLPINANISMVSSLGTCSTASKAMVNCISHSVAECNTLAGNQFGTAVSVLSTSDSCPASYTSGQIFSQSPAANAKIKTPATLSVRYCQ
jgi:hypothetical protein